MKPPLKILRLITRMNIGGPSIHVSVLARDLKQIGEHSVENHLLFGDLEAGEGDMSDLLDGSGATLHRVPELKQQVRLKDDRIAFWKIRRVIKQVNPHIIHTHTAKAGILGRLAALSCGVPVILHTYHGHSFSGYFSKTFSAFFRLVDRLLNRFSTRVISISPELTAQLCNVHHVVNRAKIAEINLGLPLDPFLNCPLTKMEARQKLGFLADKTLIGCVGRLVPIKNHLALLSAWAKTSAEFRQKTRLVLVGDGELREVIAQKISELGLTDDIIRVPFTRDLPPYYRAFDAFILPSLNEGTPVTLLEAMATSTPVIASEVGGVPDLLGAVQDDEGTFRLRARGLGFSSTEEAITAMLNSLSKYLPELIQITPAAKEFSKLYSQDRLVKDLAELYAKL